MDLSERPVELAVRLARGGAGFVVVGGTARRLRGSTHRPRDLDIVIEPSAASGLLDVLAFLGARVPARLRSGTPVATPWGPLDVFTGRCRTWLPITLHGTVVQVSR